MKLMKHITIALVLCAIPAVAVGQGVTCDDCKHVVSVYMGEGGLIATAAEGAEMVNFLATCENVTRTGELMPNDDGMVSMLLTGDYACHGDDEDNSFEIGPIMDGGWYWITMETNSAVGGLVAKNVLENDNEVMPTSAGDGVKTVEGQGAVLLTETATGRVGILPTILPVMDMAEAAVNYCSFTTKGTVHTRETSNCMLGNGGSMLLVEGPTDLFTGKRPKLGANAMVRRPASGSVTVQADLWGNGTGHFTSDASGDARLGHAGGTRLEATIAASLTASGPGEGQNIDTTGPGGTAGAGLTFDGSTTASLGVLTITSDPAYCNPTAKPPVNHTATVMFTGSLTATQKGQTTPSLTTTPATADPGVAARHTIMVVCPTGSAAANMGQELVPENPFPVE